ncbi:tRNA preQ1(34) S-adenosylmethionine ribosyltransferase-isomerase QueA [Microgenomates group bacterium]|nr:tRNA preQ1(34) S-adenosylmethionine ribosyltransferase-isomerase QueA [Microgenomates group bacterium]
MLSLKNFTYTLPEELIAHSPAARRDESRLLVFDKNKGEVAGHRRFFELGEVLEQLSPTPLMIVRNKSAVIPARLKGHKIDGAGRAGKETEILLARQQDCSSKIVWECLTRPRLKEGERVVFGPENASDSFVAECKKNVGYTRLISFERKDKNNRKDSLDDFYRWVNKMGCTPLPPYIKSDKKEDELRELYQTVYADKKAAGSVAAPTAGLHFTDELLARLGEKYPIVDLTLHVGLGTFLGVKETDIAKHQMHAEAYSLSEETAREINEHKARGGEILAIGTTTTRVLESCWDEKNKCLTAGEGETDIFIYPPYKFRAVDHLLTNFHLSESTLLMLIAALTSRPNVASDFETFPKSPIGRAYRQAIANKYRFFSFGDAMLIW